MTALELIDSATQDVRQILHRHGIDPLCRDHLDRVMAHLHEAWIAQDGQNAETVDATVKHCLYGKSMEAWILEKDQATDEVSPVPSNSQPKELSCSNPSH